MQKIKSLQDIYQVMLSSERVRVESIGHLSTLEDVLSSKGFYFLIQAIQDGNLRYISHLARHNKEIFHIISSVPFHQEQDHETGTRGPILETIRSNNPVISSVLSDQEQARVIRQIHSKEGRRLHNKEIFHSISSAPFHQEQDHETGTRGPILENIRSNNPVISSVPSDQEQDRVIVTSPILEAIRSNNPEMFFLIRKHMGPEVPLVADTHPLFTLDPLSQAVYISTFFDKEKETSKAKGRNLQIINMIMEEKFDPNYKNYLGLDAMEWALLVGAEDMVRRLHEVENIPFPKNDPFKLGIKYEDLAFRRKSLDLYQYIVTANEKSLLNSPCANVFVH